MPDFVVAIPARHDASRLPGKPLRLLGDKPLVWHVAQRALDAGGSAPALIAELLEEDDHGLLPWCFGEIGRTVEPFSDLRLQQPDTWMACEAAFR